MRPFHPPRKITERAYSGYTPEQDAKWHILSDVAYAAAYGYAQTRLPTPGVTLGAGAVEQRMTEVGEGWNYESKRDRGSTGLNPAADLPKSTQYHLAERLDPYPQTDRPWQPRIIHPEET